MIVNIRGTSGSGKSTLVHRFLAEHPNEPVETIFNNWKTPRVVAYKCYNYLSAGYQWASPPKESFTFVIGSYKTQCGGCDSLSYKGSHDDIQWLVETAAVKGNVIFEGLTISSTYGRWLKTGAKFPGQMVWAFMNTPEEECYRRIIARSGREPKRDAKGQADYNRKWHGCQVQRQKLLDMGERVIDISSDDEGYKKLLEVLGASSPS